MASRVVMPKLTDTMEEGVVVKWKKREGDVVGSGDVLAEIETDKAVMDLEAFASGTLRRVLVSEGTTVKAGGLIAVIADPDEDIAPVLAETMSLAPTVRPTQAGPTLPAPTRPGAQPAREEDRVKASPRAKTMARERGIDLASVTGSGPGGRIVEEDILKAGGAVSPRTTGATDRPLSQMRKAIARTTTQSKAPVPHFYLTTEIAMDEAERLRTQLKQTRRFHPSLTDVIVKAAAIGASRTTPTASAAASGGIRTAMKLSTSNIPRLETEKVAPVYSCGWSRLFRARSMSARASVEICSSVFAPQSRSTGEIRPSSSPTAIPISMVAW